MESRHFAIWSLPAPLAENPYQRLLYEALETEGWTLLNPTRRAPFRGLLREGRDARLRYLHVHWIWLKRGFFARRLRALRARLLLRWARLCGWRIAVTVHNLSPHDAAPLDRRLHERLLAAADALIAHGEGSAAELRRLHPETPVAVIPHGHYRSLHAPLPRADRKAVPTFLFLGQLHPYKGVEELISSFRASELKAALVIAGRPRSDEFAATLRELAGDDPRIELDLRFIPDAEVPRLAARADWAVFPFRQITTSGSLILALGLELGVVIADHADLAETAGDAAIVWRRDEELVEALRRACAADPRVHSERARLRCEELGWEEIGRRTAAFLQAAASAAPSLSDAP